ncbi:hypothetical protein WME79_12180 [Sorangium sp. So ce726]|uniref:hypothetical protein n=1 Tax=Sorangium sp. So ce726 TaxID=3133319 RepID=UPI003F5E622F
MMLAALLLVGCGLSCATKAFFPLIPAAPSDRSRGMHRPANAPTILVVMPASEHVEGVWKGLRDELSGDFAVFEQRINEESGPELLANDIRAIRPASVILMDNAAVRLYRAYQNAQPAGTQFPPAVITMTSFLEDSYHRVQNATGIAYEIPGVTQFVKLRSIINRPVRRVGVVYRAPFAGFMARQKKLAEVEQIEIVGQEVGRDPRRTEVATALESLVEDEKIDALWVLNDNILLKPRWLASIWLPKVGKKCPIPVIVGVPSLLTPVHLGTFAMVPDYAALAVQTADMVFDLADGGWQIRRPAIQLPLEIKTIVALERARKQYGLKESALRSIDQTVE